MNIRVKLEISTVSAVRNGLARRKLETVERVETKVGGVPEQDHAVDGERRCSPGIRDLWHRGGVLCDASVHATLHAIAAKTEAEASPLATRNHSRDRLLLTVGVYSNRASLVAEKRRRGGGR